MVLLSFCRIAVYFAIVPISDLIREGHVKAS